MDANSLMNNKKHQKHHDGEGKDESNIRLCDLPDGILQEIISNLPTKYAVQTSVLSKRWVDQWMGIITKIELEEELGSAPEKRQHFIHFVEKLLMVCNSSRIKKFCIIFEVGEDVQRVNKWLRGFVSPNNIEELSLELESVEQPLVFPDQFFTSNTLTKFQLSMQQVINLPSYINFKNLGSLTLKHVIFPDGASAQRLFNGCWFLKELNLVDVNWMNVRIACIICPSLEKLTIREWKDDYDDEDEEEEEVVVEHDHLVPPAPAPAPEPEYCRIMIFGSNLQTFSYDGDLINDYFLSCTNSVSSATVEVHQPNNNLNVCYFVFKLLRTLFNVEKLSISDYAAETLLNSFDRICRSLSKALGSASCLMRRLPLFHQLVELCVVSTSPINLSCQALQAILRKSPLLEVMEFVMGVSLGENGANEIDPLPGCFGTHLKTIRICGFSGKEGELNAIKFLLQTTPVLDTLYIYTNPYDDFDSPEGTKRLKRLFQQIVRFPTASDDVEIDLE